MSNYLTLVAFSCAMTLAIFAPAATAQQANCPVKDASVPRSPPGKPPDFMPRIPRSPSPPGPGDKPVIEPPEFVEGVEVLAEVEEGHVTKVARTVQYARSSPPSQEVYKQLVDPGKTALASWKFAGYLPISPPHKVERVFSKDGSVLVFEQWNMAADGASMMRIEGPKLAVGRYPATRAGLKSPSGCVNTTLTWWGDGVTYSLSIVGPLSVEGQRSTLMTIAQSIAAADGKR